MARAVEHYKTKYGATPTLCFVNPSMLTAERAPEVAGGVQLRPARMVLVTTFVIALTTAANALGPQLSGLLAPLTRAVTRFAYRRVRAMHRHDPPR